MVGGGLAPKVGTMAEGWLPGGTPCPWGGPGGHGWQTGEMSVIGATAKGRRGRSSAGILLYRLSGDGLQVLIVHPGGPYWARRDDGAWSLPKGEVGPDEDPAQCASREFEEELGVPVPTGEWADLGEVVQKGGKRVRAWGVAGELDPERIRSGTFEMEWPPRSGRSQSFPEVDRAAWVDVDTARVKLVSAQAAFLDRLQAHLGAGPR